MARSERWHPAWELAGRRPIDGGVLAGERVPRRTNS
jgi:hypothetical protein